MDPKVIKDNLTVKSDGYNVSAVCKIITEIKSARTIGGSKILKAETIGKCREGGKPRRNNCDGTRKGAIDLTTTTSNSDGERQDPPSMRNTHKNREPNGAIIAQVALLLSFI